MTFKLELSNNKIFKDIFESISNIIDEVVLECDSEGIRLKALDRSHITFVNMELTKDLFDEYVCSVPEKLNIDTSEFIKVLKKCKTSDILRLTVDEGNVILIFEGDATRKFNLRLIDMNYEPATPPKIDHPVNLKIPSNVLKDALTDMSIFSDKIKFIVNQDYLIIKADGTFGDGEIKYLHGEHVTDIYTSLFSFEKLKDMMKASGLSETCILSLGDDIPLELTFELITGDGALKFLLAPRLEETD